MHLPRLCLVLSPTDRAQLEQVVTNGKTPQKWAKRASALLWQATGRAT